MDRAMPIFRRRSNGKWAVVGPDHLVVAGEMVTACKKDGSTSQVFVEEVSRPFFEDGQRKVWGYILEGPKAGSARIDTLF